MGKDLIGLPNGHGRLLRYMEVSQTAIEMQAVEIMFEVCSFHGPSPKFHSASVYLV